MNDLKELFLYDFSEVTSEITLKKQKQNLEEIEDYYYNWIDLLSIIDSTYEDSPFAILNYEASSNVDASIFLAINGFYKQAIALLRLWFETCMYSLYFQDHPIEFDKWSLGTYSPKKMFMLNFDELLKYIFQFHNFDEFNNIYKKHAKKKDSALPFTTFGDWVGQLYGELSAHIHSRGYSRSSLASLTFRKGEQQLYSKKYFLRWCDLFDHVFHIITISFLLYNPNLMNRFYKKRKFILESIYDEIKDILIKDFGIKN